MQVFDRHLAVLALDEFVHHARAERSRPVQGVHGHQVLETVGFEHAQVFAHAFGFDLEDAVGVAGREQGVSVGIVEGEIVQVRRIDPHAADDVERVLDHGHGAQAEKVELDQARPFDLLHVPLGDDFLVFAPVERHVLGHGPVRDDHPGGVGRGVARDALQAARNVEQLGHPRVGPRQPGQFRFALQSLGDGHLELFGHQLGDAVGLGEAHAHGPAHVADDRLGLHGAEGGDLGHAVGAVLLGDVADDLHSAAFAKIHVDIRQADAFAVEKSLEEQIVGQGVQVGDAQGEGHQRPGRRAAPRSDRDALGFGPVDEVGHDQEIAGKTQFDDDLEFVFQALFVLLPVHRSRHFGQAFGEARAGEFGQLLLQGLARPRLVGRKIMLAQIERQVDLVRDHGGIGQRLGDMAEGRGHFLGRFEIQVRGGHAHALGVAHAGRRLDAQQNVVGLGVGPGEIVAVVGGHQGQPGLGGDLDELLVGHRLFRDVVGLEFEIETAGKKRGVFLGRRKPGAVALFQGLLDHLAFETGRQGDQAAAVFGQDLLVDARLVVEAAQMPDGRELEQVFVAGEVLGQENEMVARVARRPGVAVGQGLGRDVRLHADDRLDAGFMRGIVENKRAVEIAVVGQGQGRATVRLGRGYGVGNADRPVEQGIFRMAVQMDEIGHGKGGGAP